MYTGIPGLCILVYQAYVYWYTRLMYTSISYLFILVNQTYTGLPDLCTLLYQTYVYCCTRPTYTGIQIPDQRILLCKYQTYVHLYTRPLFTGILDLCILVYQTYVYWYTRPCILYSYFKKLQSVDTHTK